MPKKPTFSIGSRIGHVNHKNLSEGVIVFVDHSKSKPYTIHWNNNNIRRGCYSEDEIYKLNTLSALKQIRKEIEEDA